MNENTTPKKRAVNENPEKKRLENGPIDSWETEEKRFRGWVGSLQRGWDGEDAVVPSSGNVSGVVAIVTRLVNVFRNLTASTPNLHPCVDGSVDVYWYSRHFDLLLNYDGGIVDIYVIAHPSRFSVAKLIAGRYPELAMLFDVHDTSRWALIKAFIENPEMTQEEWWEE